MSDRSQTVREPVVVAGCIDVCLTRIASLRHQLAETEDELRQLLTISNEMWAAQGFPMTWASRTEAPKPRITVTAPDEVARTDAEGYAPGVDGIPAMIVELRQLCVEPFDTLEIEGDDGVITETRVVRAKDIIAAINDHVREA